jgi:hypothetical protein
MRPINHAEAPSVERGVLARLRRLDPQLFVTWSPWAINPVTGQVIECKASIDPDTGEEVEAGAVYDPAFHLWRRDDGSTCCLVMSFPKFGHAEVRKLENDLARFMKPSAILKAMAEARHAVQKKRHEDYEDYHNQLSKANSQRIGDLVFAGRSGRRTRKIVSYAGQRNRSTPTEEFLADPKDDGWEGIEER